MKRNTPDNPRAWSPDDPLLKSPLAPHETRATLRMHRAGWPGPEIFKTLNMRGSQLLPSLQKGKAEEGDANRAGRPIHYATVDAGTV